MDEKDIVKFLRWLGDCYGMDDQKEAERVAKKYISEKKIEALNIHNVSICDVEDCNEPVCSPTNAGDLCEKHYDAYFQAMDDSSRC